MNNLHNRIEIIEIESKGRWIVAALENGTLSLLSPLFALLQLLVWFSCKNTSQSRSHSLSYNYRFLSSFLSFIFLLWISNCGNIKLEVKNSFQLEEQKIVYQITYHWLINIFLKRNIVRTTGASLRCWEISLQMIYSNIIYWSYRKCDFCLCIHSS